MTSISLQRNNSNAVASSVNRSGSTTERTLILKQISQLQKSEAALGKKLLALGNDFSAMAERIELEHEMRAIDEQIKALQILLLQSDADRTVKSRDATLNAPVPVSSSSSKKVKPDATVGTVIDVSA